MRRLFPVLCLVSSVALAQKIPLINSGEVIERAKSLYDSAKYEEAIAEYLSIPERDTNYVYMLTELGLTYNANKQFDEALKVCSTALSHPSPYRAHILRTQAIAADRKGDVEKAIDLFNKAIERYPFDASLIYNLGITYYNNKFYDKAIACFFKTLSINPFHAGSHLNLAKLSVGQGRKTHAMFSFGIYLGLRNDDNANLVMLNNFVSNQVKDEGTLPVSGVNGCEKPDQIIRARIAMDKDFKTKVPVDAFVVRQFEMLFQQLGQVTETKEDPWVDFYLDVYKTIRDKNLIEPFIFHILSSADNDVVRKWRGKNDKALTAFFNAVNEQLKLRRATLDGTAVGLSGAQQAWFDDNNFLDALGRQDAGKRKGRWVFFYNNGEKSAEGEYNEQGDKTGIWYSYFDTGIPKNTENHAAGEVVVNFETGTKHQHFFAPGDEIEGDVELYYPGGTLEQKLVYKNGKREGACKMYFPNGDVSMTFSYTNDLPHGETVKYFENGKVMERFSHHEGKLQGMSQEYFPNGKLKTEGAYVDGKYYGPWKHYHSNGALEKSGSYNAGKAIGEWMFYDTRGNITEKRTFDEDGRLHGDDVYYHNGKKHFVQTYKKDLLVRVINFDTLGNEIGAFGNNDGTFVFRRFYNTGEPYSEGAFRKGKNDGKWKFYTRYGALLSEFNYKEGMLQGEAFEYFPSGARKFMFNYADDELHGYFQEWYENGKVRQEGWFQNGNREQQWLTYHKDGSPESDYYYLNGEYSGLCTNYSIDGGLYSQTLYDKNGIVDIRHYDSKGKPFTEKKVEGHIATFQGRYPNGKPRVKYDILNGAYTNEIAKWFPDGKLYYAYPIRNGKKYGTYTLHEINGQVSLIGEYLNDAEHGLWKGYWDDGKQSSEGRYLEGELDSVWTYYHQNGKMSSQLHYLNGKRHGISRYYTPDGVPVLEKIYDDGDLVSYRTTQAGGQWSAWQGFDAKTTEIVAWYPGGTKAHSEAFRNAYREGPSVMYYPDGKKYSEYIYRAGDYEGPYAYYHPNGKVMEKGVYKYDELDGKVEFFYSDGTPRKTLHYKMGLRHGPAIYYPKGGKKIEYQFVDNLTE